MVAEGYKEVESAVAGKKYFIVEIGRVIPDPSVGHLVDIATYNCELLGRAYVAAYLVGEREKPAVFIITKGSYGIDDVSSATAYVFRVNTLSGEVERATFKIKEDSGVKDIVETLRRLAVELDALGFEKAQIDDIIAKTLSIFPESLAVAFKEAILG